MGVGGGRDWKERGGRAGIRKAETKIDLVSIEEENL